MNYSFFLFSQLYNEIVGLKYEYDELFVDLNRLYDAYSVSHWNDFRKPQYECMESFLKESRTKIIDLKEGR